MKTLIACSLALVVFAVGCKKKEVDLQAALNWEAIQQKPRPPLPPAATWPEEQAQRRAALQTYIDSNAVAYAWFTQFPFGKRTGTPYILLKLLPTLAPEIWGTDTDNPLALAGLFRDTRLPDNYPVPRGIGWTGMTRQDPSGAVDHASFSCSACHIGRVRLDDGSFEYLDGGVNTHFNLSAYRVAIQKTIEKLTGEEGGDIEKLLKATHTVNEALDQVHAADPTFFYNDYTFEGRRFDADYEAQQVERFKKESEFLMTDFLLRNKVNYQALEALIDENYQGFESEMLRGFGGMVDATGTFASWGFVLANDAKALLHIGKQETPPEGLPPTPGITDFMVVWEQDKRKVRWNEDETVLIDGGGQWNGNIPIPMYRNMAAQLTLGLGPDTDFRISALAVILLEGLAAPVYPFDVDMALAAQGKVLYDANCASCHRPHNGAIYNIGTDSSRAYVADAGIVSGARGFFTKMLPATSDLWLPPDSLAVAPTAIFEDVSLVGNKDIVMRDADLQHGYNALPLGGVWAQAPYLHNGSVPTIYHLLVPSERPTAFLKSSLDYDKEKLGFAWTLDHPKRDSAAYVFDTSAFHAFTNAGHDTDIVEDGKTYRLDWSGDADRDSVMAIIEYMKTL